ncbi:MAG: hypothetical protein HY830_24805 [Actinobacteria bacterium]|nr:hypothetical protein [Actinomycetota bacterium]
MPLLATVAVAASSSSGGPTWADAVQAWGTLAAAVVAVGGLGVALWQARAARAAADADRKAADARLRAERADGERRLVEEREFLLHSAKREREIGYSGAMLDRIDDLQRCLDTLPCAGPSLSSRKSAASMAPTNRYHAKLESSQAAVISLQKSARVDAVMLGRPEITARYRTLAHLVLTAYEMELVPDDVKSRIAGDLRNFSKYVRLSLQALIDDTEIPPEEIPPRLDRSRDGGHWHPTNVPPNWAAEADLDPTDPQYRPAT